MNTITNTESSLLHELLSEWVKLSVDEKRSFLKDHCKSDSDAGQRAGFILSPEGRTLAEGLTKAKAVA